MKTDRHAHVLSGTGDEAARHYERALDALLFFRGEVADEAQAMVAASPNSAMAHVFGAYLGLLGTEEKEAAGARRSFSSFRGSLDLAGLSPREKMHTAAAEAWLDGDMRRAGEILGEVSSAFPRDALALAVGHQIDFFTGDAQRLRDRIGGALSAWDDDDPHFGPLLGMYAFGLEEAGHYDHAEEVGLRAVERHPRDVWGIHAVVHTYEMRGLFGEGIRYLDARTQDWAEGNYLSVHNAWHYALYALEAGSIERVLGVYDSTLHNEQSQAIAMELLDASALLWRLLLADVEVETRWAALAGAWAGRQDGAHYAFNDVHAVMAYAGAGRLSDAERLVKDREQWLDRSGPAVSNHAMTREIGIPVCRALIAYRQQQYGRVVELLAPIRYHLNSFGGSHAQRDAIQRTLVEAAIRSGRHDLARTLLSERINLRPICPYNWRARARLDDRLGDAARAAAARARAEEQAAAGAAAWV
ncbi:tetratricopeptide repeat protein 38 family protein [Streptomyces longisporoflavus]|uniref:tetratricopeptide repeat protein n=1 Tax=Streptomyces longisporoflavus TaxID=28044 RepID=UPI00167D4382|nr:tetratricopeptide repeat protein [Streptomyces longisporoflavus]GGV29909.1 tetratricopeptide repeat protein 38 family protein [Streptomyces longisporoflavus]